MNLGMNTKLILDSISAPIVIIDRDKSIVYVNDSYELMIKIPKQSLIGKNILSVRPDSRIGEVVERGVPLRSIKRQSDDHNFFTDIYPIFKKGEIIGAISTSFEQSTIQQLLDRLDSNEQKIKTLTKQIFSTDYTFDNIIGESDEIKAAIRKSKKFANKIFPIFLQGESGTGKELFAQSIHSYSNRNQLPFVAVNCATLETNLLESELFGYTAGSFTDANKEGKQGLFKEADGGTIFLDEITEISISTQSKLLRVLQEGKIRPIGSNEEIPVNVRVICSTNKNISHLIAQGLFKEDLFFRISTFTIEIPPLRKRADDILLIANNFANKNNAYYQFDEKYIDFLYQYQWPGNIRELKNVIEFSKAMSTNDRLSIDVLPEYLKDYAFKELINEDKNSIIDEIIPLKEFTKRMEKQYILSLLDQYPNDADRKKTVANLLNISLASLYNKIR